MVPNLSGAAAALAAGNAVIVKPDSKTPLSALRLARAVHDAGMPAGILTLRGEFHLEHRADAVLDYDGPNAGTCADRAVRSDFHQSIREFAGPVIQPDSVGRLVIRDEGIQIACEQIEEFKEMKGVAGIHLMPIEWEHKVPEIAERARRSVERMVNLTN